MEGCVFCKIIKGEIPAQKLMEDDNFVAFLGIFPKFEGMTVVVTKKHFDDSYLYRSLPEGLFVKMHLFAKKMGLTIDKALGSMRCIQLMEGLETVHPHLKLFPLYEGKSYGVAFEGTIQTEQSQLKDVAEKIKSVRI